MSEEKNTIIPLKPGDAVPEGYRKLFKMGDYTDEMIKKEQESATKTFAEVFDEDVPMIVYVPELGYNIKFRPLTVSDLQETSLIKDDLERGDEILFRQLQAGDSTVTKKKFERLVVWKKNAMIFAIGRKTPFLEQKLPEDLSQKDSGDK